MLSRRGLLLNGQRFIVKCSCDWPFSTCPQVQFWEEFYQDVLSEFLYLHQLDRDRLKIEVLAPPQDAVLEDRQLAEKPKILIPLYAHYVMRNLSMATHHPANLCAFTAQRGRERLARGVSAGVVDGGSVRLGPCWRSSSGIRE